MNNEQKMLEAAAAALGVEHDGYHTVSGRSGLRNVIPCPDGGVPEPRMVWNPWADDGDAFRLAAHTGAQLWFQKPSPQHPFGMARASLNGVLATAAPEGPFYAAECLRHALVIVVSGVSP